MLRQRPRRRRRLPPRRQQRRRWLASRKPTPPHRCVHRDLEAPGDPHFYPQQRLIAGHAAQNPQVLLADNHLAIVGVAAASSAPARVDPASVNTCQRKAMPVEGPSLARTLDPRSGRRGGGRLNRRGGRGARGLRAASSATRLLVTAATSPTATRHNNYDPTANSTTTTIGKHGNIESSMGGSSSLVELPEPEKSSISAAFSV